MMQGSGLLLPPGQLPQPQGRQSLAADGSPGDVQGPGALLCWVSVPVAGPCMSAGVGWGSWAVGIWGEPMGSGAKLWTLNRKDAQRMHSRATPGS